MFTVHQSSWEVARHLLSQGFALEFVQGTGFDFNGYIAARQASATTSATTSGGAIKSAITFVIDWLAALWKSASDAQVAEEWTNNPDDGQAESVLKPLVSLAIDSAEGLKPVQVTELGSILSLLSDRLNRLDALNEALPDDQVYDQIPDHPDSDLVN